MSVLLKVKAKKDSKNKRQTFATSWLEVEISQLRVGDIFKKGGKLFKATAMPHIEKGEWDIEADFLKKDC